MQVFVKGAAKYFKTTTSVPAEIGTPYLKDEELVMLDFSAAIGISGNQKGCVYYTVPWKMAYELTREIGEAESSDEIFADMIGEIANTIAGNAREDLGSGFMISVPIVLNGKPDEIRFPAGSHTFIIPVFWKDHKSFLVICLTGMESVKLEE